MAKRLRAAIYARFSSDKQRDASIEDQVSAGTRYCERKDYELVMVYTDYALSGRSDDRPDFLRMIDGAKKGLFDVVVVWKLDRFARNMMDQFHYERELKLSGVTLESCKENISGGTMEADMNKGMLAIFAQIRSQQSAVDTMRGMLGKAEKCQYLGYYWFGYSHEGDVITLDPLNAPLARRIHDDYLAGTPIDDLLRVLIAAGVKTKNGNDPGYSFVTGILKSWVYAGVYQWGKRKDERGRVIKDAHGQPVPLVRVENGIPAIVSRETKIACLERLRYRKHCNARVDYLLSGKLECSLCNKLMHGETGTSKTGAVHTYYVAKDNGSRYSIAKDVIEDAVAKGIREMLEDRELCRKLALRHVEYLNDVEDQTPALEAAQAEKKSLERQLGNVVDAISKGAPYEVMAPKMEALKADLAHAEARMIELQSESESATAADIMEFFEAISAGAMTDKQIISAFVGNVIYDGESALAVMNFDDKPTERYEIEWFVGGGNKTRTRRSDGGFVKCKYGAPNGNRTRISALKGPRPNR